MDEKSSSGTTAASTAGTVTIRFFTLNMDYAKSLPGILKAAGILLSLISFICVAAGTWFYCDNWGSFRFFEFVSMASFWSAIIIYLVYFLNLDSKITMINWVLTEMIWSAIDCICFFIASVTIIATTSSNCVWDVGAFQAAGAFGFFCMAIFGVNAGLAFMEFRGSTTQRSTSSGPSPSQTVDDQYM